MIKGHKVFISKEKDRFLRDYLLKDKSPEYQISSRIRNHPESDQFDELVFDFLLDEFNKDFRYFEAKWLKIDFDEQESKENIWDILYDYCFNKRYYKLRDIRDFIEIMEDDFNHKSLTHPMGKSFYLNIISHSQSILSALIGKKAIETSILIDSDNIFKISGSLDVFIINSKDFTLYCHDKIGISIFPPNIDTQSLNKLLLDKLCINQ